MSLFQSVVVTRYVNQLDTQVLDQAWQRYIDCFLDLVKQDNIRLSKEEQYQEGFLRDLFVDVFGYTLNPNPNYDLTTEFKNQTSSKKADGAILKDGHAIGVVELKGMNTTDLSKIEQQAFGYKNNQPQCRYVITSNFQKLRLYIDNAVEFIEFNLFTMTQDKFALLYLLLHRDGVMADLPAKIKSESLSQEEAITKQLYRDYSVFKRELFADLTTKNPDIAALVLFQKSQKLLDRLLFIFFAEDSHLLPANFAKGIISEWEQLKALKRNDPLYDQVKQYFSFLNNGYKDEHSEIFAYNGGLFSPDELLDKVIISDELLRSHILILSEYNFASEVDVNILGHIFENSLTELDEVKAQLEGIAVDKSQTKRKKDGVFYTPKYITKYIVENTVGKLCEDKKLALNEEDYQQEILINKDGTKRVRGVKQIAKDKEALDKLNKYRDWLLQITICDPAVGSGAFLNEALNFLIAEHEYIVELETKLFGSGLAYPDIENSILENNLFGVDINQESVEIAKLSLWLRTAQPHRKLNDLNNNIQCGNSLIDNKAVAGDKAFNWQMSFPQVFANGGFDVVIGNPPYVDSESMVKNNPVEREFISKSYQSAAGNWDLYVPFIELSTRISKENAYISLITPNKWLALDYGSAIRALIFNDLSIINDFTNQKVFDSANISSIVFVLDKKGCKSIKIESDRIVEIDKNLIINKENLSLLTSNSFNIINKLNSISSKVSDSLDVHAAFTTAEAYELVEFVNDIVGNEGLKLINTGTIDRYESLWGRREITYLGKKLKKPVVKADVFLKNFPKRYDKMNSSKLIITGIRHFEVFYDEKNEYIAAKSTTILKNESKQIEKLGLCILNSKLVRFFIKASYDSSSMGGGINFTPDLIRNIPFPELEDVDSSSFITKSDLIICLKGKLVELSDKLLKSIYREFNIDNPRKKIRNWHLLEYKDFLSELEKDRKSTYKEQENTVMGFEKLSLSVKAEWEEYFLAEHSKAQELTLKIERTDSEIDRMVYALYDLTEEEIAIIEAS